MTVQLSSVFRRKSMLVALTRHLQRPVHNEYKSNLIKQPEWMEADADLTVWYHGSDAPPADLSAEMSMWTDCDWLAGEFDYRGRTNGCITQLVWHIYKYAVEHDYKYVMLLDDDARFVQRASSHPDGAANAAIAVKTFIDGLENESMVAQVGPMGPLRKKWRYENNPDFLQRLRHNPWTTLGCQVYKTPALKLLMDAGALDMLLKMEFRADSFVAMLLDMHGYGVYEMDVPFAHALHSGQRSREKNVNHHYQMLVRGDIDWEWYRRAIERFAPADEWQGRAFYYRELDKLIHSHEHHHRSKIAKYPLSSEPRP